MDVLAVEAESVKAAEHVRSGEGPYFIECRTYRFRAHSMFDAELYRTKEEVEEWKKRDPLITFPVLLKENGLITDEDMDSLERMWRPGKFCRVCRGRYPGPVEDLPVLFIPKGKRVDGRADYKDHTARRCEAIREAMHRDNRVFLMGEDVARYGLFRRKQGLLNEFGPNAS
jgi:hypothetical protein